MVTPGDTTIVDEVSLAGRHAFVAGATGRIGSVVADTLAGLGADVVVHAGRSIEPARTLAKDLSERHGTRVTPVQADLTAGAQVEVLGESLHAAGITELDALVNCVTGFTGRPAPLGRLDVDEFRRVVDVDLVGSFALVTTLLPWLRPRAGRIVLMSSLAGERGRPAAAHLCAAKAGLSGLVRALSCELRPSGMRVNAVAPGPVVAEGETHPPGLPPGMAVSRPRDVARVVAFAVAGWSRGLDGQVLVVEGNVAQTDDGRAEAGRLT
ncbi:MAG TPA: SDR family NAD(P)-dependent oxidoreductase [Acidimicrobiales bacterium]|jgi:NAD(P)-dependent dehydrogenase (short-subunit alcohol dehydrogenase family)|nr:SDR family NAD(P)-dependent oxidoreductase [Acidimicrobiales bacterium]